MTSLQTGLENGEAVQKDFVLLSQSLQRELERLRGQNTTVSIFYNLFTFSFFDGNLSFCDCFIGLTAQMGTRGRCQ